MPSGSKENARKSIKKMAKALAVSKGKVYREISMLAGTAKCRKGRVSPLWMNRIQDFFFREDISRAIPGKTVSAAFKQHKAMYLLSMTVEDAYKILRDENPGFPYKFTILKKFRPPNVRSPRFSDHIQCACPKHTNVERKTAALSAIMRRLVIPNLHVVIFPGITMLIKVIFFIIFSEK